MHHYSVKTIYKCILRVSTVLSFVFVRVLEYLFIAQINDDRYYGKMKTAESEEIEL